MCLLTSMLLYIRSFLAPRYCREISLNVLPFQGRYQPVLQSLGEDRKRLYKLCMERDQAALDCQGDRFRPVGSPQLAHNRADMEFGGAFADNKLGGNLFVGHALGKQAQYFQLSLGQLFYLQWHTPPDGRTLLLLTNVV